MHFFDFQTVESMELNGSNFLWQLVTDSPSESIADQAIEYLLDTSFLWASPALRDGNSAASRLHSAFIEKCYSRLESCLRPPDAAIAEEEECKGGEDGSNESVLRDGHELEASLSGSGDQRTTKATSQSLVAIAVSNVSSMPTHIK